jgi:DnaJ-class molecular chaperone
MKAYRVVIQERTYHYLRVASESADKAIEKAYEVLSNEDDGLLREQYDYEVEAEYMGIHDAEGIE